MKIETAASEIPLLAKCLLAGGNQFSGALVAKQAQAPTRLQRLLEKGALSGAHTSDSDFGEVLVDLRLASSAFFGSLRTRSVFFRMLDAGFRRVPLRTRVGTLSAGATGWIVDEGKPAPLSKMALGVAALQPIKAAALVVVTDEVSRDASPDAAQLIEDELRGAVSDVVDEAFWDLVIDGQTPSNASTTYESDLGGLLAAVNAKGVGPLFWAMAPDVANGAALLDPGRAMTPLGGEMAGLPALVSSTIPAGTLRLINAGAIAANADPITMDATRQAAIEMTDAPPQAADVPTPAEMVSLFQTNSTALLATVSFTARRTRPDAVAEVTGVTWAIGTEG